MADDPELLRRYSQVQSETAFSEFVSRHLRLVYCAALRRTGGRTDLAQEAAQTVFIKVARNAASLSRRGSMAGWLYTAARFAANDLMRSEERRARREQASELMPSEAAASDADSTTLRLLIDDLLGTLSQSDREIVLLRYFDEQSLREIAFLLQIPEDTARKRAERAIEKMRSTLARRGITSSATALTAIFSEQAAFALPANLLTTVSQAALAGARLIAPVSGIGRLIDAVQSLGGLAGIVALLTVGMAIYEVRAERSASALYIATRGTRDEAARRLKDHEALLRASETRAAAQNPAVQDPIRAKTIPSRRDDPAGRERGQQFLAAHPEVQRLIEAETRDHVAWHNEAVGRKIGLTPAQIEGLVKLATEEQGQAFFFGGDDDFVTLNQSLGDLTPEQVKAQTRALLGEAAYERFTEEKRIGDAVRLATEAATALNFLGTSMTPTQTQALEQIIIGASPDYRSGKSVKSSALEWDAIMAQARSLLSPDQMRAVAALKARETADQEEAAYQQVLLAQVKGKP